MLAIFFIIPVSQNQSISKNIFQKAPVRGISIAMNTNSAFSGLYTENPFWYQQFDPRQFQLLKDGQPNENFDAADNCHLYATTMKATNFRDDIPFNSKWCQRPLYTSVSFDFNAGCYWKLFLPRTSLDTTDREAKLYCSSGTGDWTYCFGGTNVFGCSWGIMFCWEYYLKWTMFLSSKKATISCYSKISTLVHFLLTLFIVLTLTRLSL